MFQSFDSPPNAAGISTDHRLTVYPAAPGEKRIFTVTAAERNRKLASSEGCTVMAFGDVITAQSGWLLAVPDGVLLEPGFRARLAPVMQPVQLRVGAASVVWGPADQVAAWLKAGGSDPLPTQQVDKGLLLEVLTSDGRRQTRAALLARSGKASDGPIARHLNRPVSRQFTRAFLWLGLSKNFASLVCLVIGIAAGWYAAQPSYFGLAFAGILYQSASLFDGVDGEIARITMTESPRGAWLDSTIDYITHFLAFVGLIVGWLREGASFGRIGMLVALLASVVALLWGISNFVRRHGHGSNALDLTQFAVCLYAAAAQSGSPRSLRIASGSFPIVRRDLMALVLMGAALTGFREAIGLLIVYGVALGSFVLIFHSKRLAAMAKPDGIPSA